MKPASKWFYPWIFYLAASFYYGAVFLRTMLVYQNPELSRALGLLLVWLVLAASEPLISGRWPAYFPLYLVCQTILPCALLSLPDASDFFAALLIILSMQVMMRLDPRLGALWIGLCAVIMGFLFWRAYGPEAIAFTLIYTAGQVFLGSYALATRRAQAARLKNQQLAGELGSAIQQLQTYSTRREQLAVARERNRLARELHDSVTQTVFSMTLTTESALLLVERDPTRLKAQLEHLGQLAQGALGEIQVLVSELHPAKVAGGGLVVAIRRHLAERRLPDGLSVSLEVEGEGALGAGEEQGLFRIVQEALNNIVKHSQASQAYVRLHLAEPCWLEVADQGQGFDLQQARTGGGVGLAGMSERAAEIGWNLQVRTAPGSGTRIRAERIPAAGR
jgi:signal transduction histidine kinase